MQAPFTIPTTSWGKILCCNDATYSKRIRPRLLHKLNYHDSNPKFKLFVVYFAVISVTKIYNYSVELSDNSKHWVEKDVVGGELSGYIQDKTPKT
jgi:hypothetical protein